MKYCRQLLYLLIILLVSGIMNPNMTTAGEGYLWNVTMNGDTLHYLNGFPRDGFPGNYRLPQYLPPDMHRRYVQEGTTGSELRLTRDVRELMHESTMARQSVEVQTLKRSHRQIWMPIAAMGITGAVSAYFKLEANQAYDRYQHSIDHSKIEQYYNRTRKYDTYSGISFVLLQASFGWLIYEFMW